MFSQDSSACRLSFTSLVPSRHCATWINKVMKGRQATVLLLELRLLWGLVQTLKTWLALLLFPSRCCTTSMWWSEWEEAGRPSQAIYSSMTPAACCRSPVWMARHPLCRANHQSWRTWIQIITWWSLPPTRLRRRLNETGFWKGTHAMACVHSTV